jgi:hypothetical protein
MKDAPTGCHLVSDQIGGSAVRVTQEHVQQVAAEPKMQPNSREITKLS